MLGSLTFRNVNTSLGSGNRSACKKDNTVQMTKLQLTTCSRIDTTMALTLGQFQI